MAKASPTLAVAVLCMATLACPGQPKEPGKPAAPVAPAVPTAAPVPAAATEALADLLRRAAEYEAQADRSPDEALALRAKAMGRYASALKLDPSSTAARDAIGRLQQSPEVLARRTELELEILAEALAAQSAEAGARVDELRALDPLAPDLAALARRADRAAGEPGSFNAGPAEVTTPEGRTTP